MTTTERKEQTATWDGNPTHWVEYVKRVRLQYERTPHRKRTLLGAELAGRLTGRAWDVTSAEIDHGELQKTSGAAYLLRFLEDRLCKAPVPDTGQRLEDFFMRLRRTPGSSMTEWATQLREAYRRLQRAMARQRKDMEQRFGTPKVSSPTSPSSARRLQTGSPAHSQRRRSDVTSPGFDFQMPQTSRDARVPQEDDQFDPNVYEPNAENNQQQEAERREPEAEGYARVRTEEENSSWSGNGWRSDGRYTAEEWRQWYQRRWHDDASDYDAFPEVQDEIQWDQFEYGDEKILPDEILGWLLLRRSGLPASARLAVLSAINNRLDLDTMERAMRDQEEELLLAEAQRSRGDLQRPRRSFWVEEDSQWGLVADLDQEEIQDGNIHWVGDTLPPEVYANEHTPDESFGAWTTWLPDGQELHWEWCDDDFYATDAAGCYWSWAETKTWLDVEDCMVSSPDKSTAVQEAFGNFQRTFQESRTLNSAKHLSRGFYPLNMFKGKGKPKGKSKGKNSGKPSKGTVLANFGGKGSGQQGQKPGSPDYRGCFICGAKDHDFRRCPKRDQSAAGSTSSRPAYGNAVLFVEEASDVFMVADGEESTAMPVISEAFSAVSREFPGHAVIDCGATESISSLEALEEIMTLRARKYGVEDFTVHQQRRAFRFGNGEMKKAESYVEIPQTLAGHAVSLGVHALDAPGVPLLLSVKTLRVLGAVVDFEKDMLCCKRIDEDHWIPLKRASNGHLLLDLTRDWFFSHDDANMASSSAPVGSETVGAYMVREPSVEMSVDEGVSNQREVLATELSEGNHEDSQEALEGVAKNTACHVDSNQQSYQQLPVAQPPDEPLLSGSSMRATLPFLATIAAVTSSVNHGLFGTKSFEDSSGRWQQWQTKEDEQAEGTVRGQVRSQSRTRCGPTRSKSPRLPMLWPACSNAPRQGEPDRGQQTRSLGGLRKMQNQGFIHPHLWQHRPLQAGRATSCRHHHRLGASGQEGGDRSRSSGEAECQECIHHRSGGVPSSSFEEVGDRSSQHRDSQPSAVHPEHHRGAEEGSSPGRQDGGASGSRGMGQGGFIEDQHVSKLSDGQKSFLLQKAEIYLNDIAEVVEELYDKEIKPEIMEVCCPPDSKLVQTFLNQGRNGIRIGLPAIDLSTKKGAEELSRMVEKLQPSLLWFSLPCGPYSGIQTLFNEDTPEKLQRSLERKKKSKRLIYNGVDVANQQLQGGREIAWEWPVGNQGWKLPRVKQLFKKLAMDGNLYTAHVDGCAYGLKSERGLPIRKPWKIQTTIRTLARSLSRQCPGHQEHDECLGGQRAKESGFYPQAMCDVICKAVREWRCQLDSEVFPAYPVFDTKTLVAEKPKDYEPLTEEEKKQALKIIEKLHRRTGHPSNTALAGTLRHRGAHPDVVELASKHRCSECQELRAAPLDGVTSLSKSEVMWDTLAIDNAEFPADGRVIHCMIMVDEASRLTCVHFLFEHEKTESRNATAEEVIKALEETWVRHYGLPSKIKLDPEGAFRSSALGLWGEERGVEILPCAAECHGQIGVVERSIQAIKATTRQLLQGSDLQPWPAILQACQAHNEMEKVEGFSPFQWAFGRQPSLPGRFHENGFDDPWFTSSGVPGSNMAGNLALRVKAQQTFLKHQAYEQISRAGNAKTRRLQVFLPGDLVYFKRVKPPAQPLAMNRMPQRLWQWYGPARVLASETRTDAHGMERKPSHVVWIVTHGRLKRCAPEQLRHASAREQAIAEGSQAPTASWTFHSLAQTLYKGEFEILDDNIFPEDLEAKGPPRERRSQSVGRSDPVPKTPRRSRSVSVARGAPEKRLKETSKEERSQTGGDGAHQRATVSKMPKETGLSQKQHTEASLRKIPGGTSRGQDAQNKNTAVAQQPSNSSSSDGPTTGAMDVQRYLQDPSYDPPAVARPARKDVSELFEQPLFKKQRKELVVDDGLMVDFQEDMANFVCTFDLDLPTSASEWKRMRRSPNAYFVKKVRNTEVKWHQLDASQKIQFEAAKQAEVNQWLAAEAVRKAIGPVPLDRVVNMRWVLTWKESGAAKGRIVLIGFQDPDLASIQSSAPTMNRRTRQTCLQYSSTKLWKVLKADVKAAFLQGDATETSRQLFARPVPELSKALGLKENEIVQVLKSCYGLVTAPASWFKCVNKLLLELGFVQSRTDPCLWLLYGRTPSGEKDTLGYICSHVDDFIISGNEEADMWIQALERFHARFKWSPWEFQAFSHCGVKIKEEQDFSYSLDHQAFCESIEQIVFTNRNDSDPVTPDEMTQLRGVLGALQWRSHQTAPHIAARLGQLQSQVSHANVATLRAANRLVRDNFQNRHLTTRINQLNVSDPKEVVFVGWSDAALANRIDLSSTGGYVIAACHPSILEGKRAVLSCMSWRSGKLARKARSSLAAETQALSETDQELVYVRMQWAELCALDVDLKEPHTAVSKISGTVVIDAKALYDVLQKKDLNSSGAGLKDKFSALEALCLMESLEKYQTNVRWVHSNAQVADALTKPLPSGILEKILTEGRWALVYDPDFTSAKKLKKAHVQSPSQDTSTTNVFGACEFLMHIASGC